MAAAGKRSAAAMAAAPPPAKRAAMMPSLAPAMEREMPETCPECGGDDIVENWGQGNAECRGCGLVLAERLLDLGSEWRTFTQEEGDDPNRVGGPANPLLEGELGTDIGGGGGRGGGGNRLSASLHRAQQRNATSNADKTMISVIGRIDRFVERLSLSGAVAKRAKELFKTYHDHVTRRPDGTRSRTLREEEVTDCIAAAIFVSCRNIGVARTYKEICALTGVTRKIIGATVKKMEIAMPNAKTALVRKTDDFVTRFCTNLSLPRPVINAADFLSVKVHENVLYGKTYTTVAAASIYVITQLCKDEYKRSPAEIATVSGVAEVTIRSTYKLMYKHIKASLPPDFKHHEPFEKLPVPHPPNQ